MAVIQSEIRNLATGIENHMQSIVTKVEYKSLIAEVITLETIQLMFADLLTVIMENDAHKLFYLKSKLDASIGDGSTMSQAQVNYHKILKSELDKLNK